MNKELGLYKELNNINETIILMLQFPLNTTFEKELIKMGGGKRKQVLLKLIKQTLSTPTADEICKALDKYYGFTKYKDIQFSYINRGNIIGFVKGINGYPNPNYNFMQFSKYGFRTVYNVETKELRNVNMTINNLKLAYDITTFFINRSDEK